MKKIRKKVQKPSDMGLHKTIRIKVKPTGKSLLEQEDSIIDFVIKFYQIMSQFIGFERTTEEYTQKFARFVSKAFLFEGYTDDAVFDMLIKAKDRRRKMVK